MRIGIDARLVTYRRGMGNYVYHLLLALSEMAREHQLMLYVDDLSACGVLPKGPHITARVLRPRFYPLWEQVSLPLAAIRDRVDILHCPANTAPLIFGNRIRLVLTIHDVMFLMPRSVLPASPSAYQRMGRLYCGIVVPFVARRATRVITVSRSSRDDIEKHLGMNGNSVRVIWEAANIACRVMGNSRKIASIRDRHGLVNSFILAIAGTDPRKNTVRIVEAYAQLPQQLRSSCQLVLIGCSHGQQMRLRRLSSELKIAEGVVLTGFVSEEDLVALYNSAEMLVYPSLYEGFGLPVLEAMSCGTPVVTSPVGAIPEVGGDAVVWVDPLDSKAISNGMQRVLTDEVLAKRLRSAGLIKASQFSWQRAATETLQIYEEIAGCA